MAKSLKMMLLLCLLCSLTAVMAQQFPLWERLLRYYGAKTDDTRERRLETAIDWISEGKSRNWKYEALSKKKR